MDKVDKIQLELDLLDTRQTQWINKIKDIDDRLIDIERKVLKDG